MERSYKNQARNASQGHFRPTIGPAHLGGYDYRGTFHGHMPRPIPIHPQEGHQFREQFHPIYSYEHSGRFFSPPRARQAFHHGKKYGEFTPPRPFHGWNKTGGQNAGRMAGQRNYQRPDTKKGNIKFNSHRYFKESMLEDPWKELVEKKKLEQTTEIH